MEKLFLIQYYSDVDIVNKELTKKGVTVKQIVSSGNGDGKTNAFVVLEYPDN